MMVSAGPRPGLVGVVVPLPAAVAAIGCVHHGGCVHDLKINEQGVAPMIVYVDMGDASTYDEIMSFYQSHHETILAEAKRVALTPRLEN